ncbi:MAG: NAD(P)-binding protein [Steroidobacteraceae bacterium]
MNSKSQRAPPTPIARRDFLNGMACVAGTALMPEALAASLEHGPDASAEEYFLSQGITPTDPRYYPPALTGMRGSHPGSFEVAHALRDGTRWDAPGALTDLDEHYDLAIVGGGISGLSAAHFFRKLHGANARILVLDNHDDFGGHAKRNELSGAGSSRIACGGTLMIEELQLYTPEAMGLLRELGIDIRRFDRYYDRNFRKAHGLKSACFFERSAFGVDKLCPQQTDSVYLPDTHFDPKEIRAFITDAPLAPQARDDLRRLYFSRVDLLPGKTRAEKVELLKHISMQTFLEQYARVHPDVVKYYWQSTNGWLGLGIDAAAALDNLWFLPPAVTAGLGLEAEARGDLADQPYIYHFPDGNASIARLLVRRLVPGAAAGSTMEDIVTARMNYAALDAAGSPVRIRLNSTAVRVRHIGDPATASSVTVGYVSNGKGYRVRADRAILACWNMVIPYLCPEMSSTQRQALAYGVKVPLVYTNVLLRNWSALKNLGVGTVYCPTSYFSEVDLDYPVSIGNYRYPSSPEQPCVLRLERVPCKPGLPAKAQYRAGRAELFTTPFSTFEHQVRDQLGRMFGAGGFDAQRDILGITVNRWPHGYAYSYSTLFDPEWPEGKAPHIVGRQRFGRIAIANADSGAEAETSIAIAEALRACRELERV